MATLSSSLHRDHNKSFRHPSRRCFKHCGKCNFDPLHYGSTPLPGPVFTEGVGVGPFASQFNLT